MFWTLALLLFTGQLLAESPLACDPDIENPVITCSDDKIEAANANCEFILPDYTLEIVATDDCDLEVEIVQSPLPGTAVSGLSLITFTATDDTGNFSECTIQISVLDESVPTIICPDDIITSTDSNDCIANVISDSPTVDDNCAVDFFVNDYNLTDNTSDYYPIGTLEIIWTVVDFATNSASCSQFITVEDNQAPSIVCPEDIQVSSNSNCEFILPDYTTSVISSDNCDPNPIITQSPIAGSTISSNTTIWFYSEDESNNIEACSMALTIVDSTEPEIICPDDETKNVASDSCSKDISIGSPEVSDNCNVDYYTNDYNNSDDASDVYNLGVTIVTWTVTDLSGLTSSCQQQITVLDNKDPEIDCPNDMVVNANENCGFELPDYSSEIVATDLCDSDLSILQSPSPGTIIYGDTEITFTATDNYENSKSCSFIVELIDNTNPEIICPDDVSVSSDLDLCSVDLIIDQPVISDNCNVDFFTNDFNDSEDASDEYDLGITIITWTVTDQNDNFATCEQEIIVLDQQIPTIDCPDDVYVIADENCFYELPDYTAELVVFDYCDSAPSISQDPAPGSLVSGINSITFTVTDFSGNSNSCSILLFVQDTNPPEIICPDDITVNTDPELCEASINIDLPEVSDNCFLEFAENSYNFTNDASDTYPLGTTQVTWTATDASDNTNSCLQIITVIDSEGPSMTCPENKEVFADENCEAVLLDYSLEVIAIDACGGTISLSQSPEPGTVFSNELTVTFTAIDVFSNSNTCQILVTASDTIDPEITCPENISQGTDLDQCSAFISIDSPLATDNCNAVTFINDFNATDNASDTYPLGTTLITWTVYDSAENENSCVQEITITDTQIPNVICPTNQLVIGDENCQAILPDFTDSLTVSDNCSNSFTITQSPEPGILFDGEIQLDFIIIDETLNESTCSILVAIQDTLNPEIICPDTIFTVSDVDLCSANIVVTQPIGEDNCGTYSFSNNITGTDDASGIFMVGSTEIIWTITDSSDNFSTCEQIVIVEDIQAPTIICIEDKSVFVNDLCTFELPDYTAEIIALDNCDLNLEITQSIAAGTFLSGNDEITFYVMDDYMNIDSCMISITLVDTINPVLICGEDITQNTQLDACNSLVTVGSPVVFENCNEFSITNNNTGTDDASGFYELGITEILWTAIDTTGNESTCIQSITIIDGQQPEIICTEDKTVYADENCMFEIPDYTEEIVAIDNCDADVTITQSPDIGEFVEGVSFMTFTATDLQGNASTCTILISVVDTIAPIVICPIDTLVYTELDMCSAYAELDIPVYDDNCEISNYYNDFNFSENASGIYPHGETNVVWTIVDNSGNTNTCSQIVTVFDNQVPEITCTVDKEVIADENCQFEMLDYTNELSATDNCDPNVIITQSPVPGELVSDTVLVTFTATDASMNFDICTIQVVVIDTISPSIICPENIETTTDLDVCSAFVLNELLEVLDNCGNVTYFNNYNSTANGNDTFPIGITEVIWTVVDDFDNSTSCSQTITVIDGQAPEITCIEDQVVEADLNCEFELPDYISQIIVLDNCDTTVDVTQDPVPGTLVSGTSIVTFFAIDDEGNTSECSIQIIVEDLIVPTITAYHSDTIIDSGENCEYILEDFTFSLEAFDNCDLDLSFTQLPEVGTIFNEIDSTYMIQLIATDLSGNNSFESFNILLTDTIAPIVTCPEDITSNASSNACGTYVLSPVPNAIDNCGPVTFRNNYNDTNNASDNYQVGVTEIVWTIDDLNENTSTCTQMITVVDNNPPLIFCTGDLIVEAIPGECEINVNIIPALLFDYCGTTNLTNDYNNTEDATDIYPVGITEVIWSVEDVNGNTASCIQSITVVDLIGPEITCPNDTIVYTDAITCDSFIELTSPVVEDDCGYDYLINDYNLTDNASDTYTIGTTVVSWEVADQYGNINTCSQSITLIDTILPTFICVDTLLTSFFEDAYPLDAYEMILQMEDNCLVDSTTLYSSLEIIDETVVGVNDVILTVEDVNGNLSTCNTVVEVLFDLEPVALCPEELEIYLDDFGNYELTVDQIDEGSYDNNLLVSLELSDSYFDCSNVESLNEIILTATDDAGLIGTCITNLIVLDTIVPLLECEDVTVYLDQEGLFTLSNEPVVSASDNCLDYIISYEIETYDCSLLGSNTIEVYATDSYENQAVCIAEVLVLDTLAPVLISCDDLNYFSSADTTCGDWINMNEIQLPDFDENCSLISATSSYFNDYTGLDINFTSPPDTSFYFELTDESISWILEDFSGNISTCESSFIVADDTAPLVNVDPQIVLFFPEGACDFSYSFTLTEEHLEDNCGIGFHTEAQDHFFNGPGTEIFAFYAVDINGNAIIDFPTQQIIVIDTIAPEINCQDTLTFYSGIESCVAEIEIDPALFVTDNCTDNLIFPSEFSASYAPGSYDYTWEIADQGTLDLIDELNSSEETLFTIEINEFGQAVFQDTLIFDYISTCNQVIHVVDTIAPWPVLFEDEIDVLTITEPLEVTIDVPSFLDNCLVDSIYVNDNEQNYLDSLVFTDEYLIGTHIIVWTVVDIYGNESQFETSLEILDNGAPEFTDCVESVEIAVNENCQFVVPDFTDYFTIEDNIEDIITVTQSIDPEVVLSDITEISVTATDLLGNIGVCTFDLIPWDTLGPNLTCLDTIFACSSIMDIQFPNYFDNCDNVTETDVLIGDDLYSDWSILETEILTEPTEIEFFATDFSGNIGSCISTYIPLQNVFSWNDETSFICADGEIDLALSTENYSWETSSLYTEIIDGIYYGNSDENFNLTDDITITVCETEFGQTIDILAYPEIELMLDEEICLEDSVFVSADISLFTNVLWTLTSESINLVSLTETDALLILDQELFETEMINISIEADNQGCITTQINEIEIFESPLNFEFSAGADIDLFNENEVTLQGEYTGSGLTYWTVIQSSSTPEMPSDNSLTPTIGNISLGNYIFELTVENGVCPSLSDSMTVFNNITIPNGISPDMNGIGDYFEIVGLLNSDKKYALTVINRWGKVVFESENYRNEWYGLNQNGDPLLEGTYYYLLTNGEQVYSNFVIIKYE